MSKALLQNYLTTLFGILAGLPVIVGGSGLVLNAQWQKYLAITSGIGIIGLGVVAKAFNVHSTLAQTEASQAKVEGNPMAPALMAQANAQVAATPIVQPVVAPVPPAPKVP